MLNLIAVLKHIRWLISRGLDAERIAKSLNRCEAVTPDGQPAWTGSLVERYS